MGFDHTRRLKKMIFIFSQNMLFQKYHTKVQNYLTKVEAEFFHSALTVADKTATITVCLFFQHEFDEIEEVFQVLPKRQ